MLRVQHPFVLIVNRLVLLVAILATAGCGTTHVGDVQSVSRIAFGSCAHQDRDQSFWQRIVAAQPDLFIFAGDTIYGDSNDMEVLARKYRTLQGHAGYQELRRTCPVLAIWDDHDYGKNDAGNEFPHKEESKKVFLDGFQEPQDSPRRQHPGNYDARILGPAGRRVQVILLDTRTFRDALQHHPRAAEISGRYTAQLDTNTTVLGETQWQWLAEQLQQPADIRLLVSTIQVLAEEHHWEKWMNFPHERERLLHVLKTSGQSGIIILSGDRHRCEISKMDNALSYPLYDITSSGLNRSWKNAQPEANRHRVSGLYGENNFGLITIDWEPLNPVITLELHAMAGHVLATESITLGHLRPEKP